MLNVKQLLAKILSTPHIIEQGTDNDWTYRKWSDGLYEAWRFFQASGLNCTSASAGTWYGGQKTIALPSFALTADNRTYGNSPSQSTGIYIYSTSVTNGQLEIDYRTHTSMSGAVCGGNFHIIGTWK